MLTIHGSGEQYCDGATRRDFLSAGLLGTLGLTLPELLRRRAAAGTLSSARHKAVIMICLNGGPSHVDMYDMKPLAPAEYRGEFRPIRTNVPGIELCEKMPQQAQLADKLVVVRSLRMIQPNHQLHECYTGYPTDARRPSFGSVVSRVKGRSPSGLPAYVSLSLTDHPRTVAKAEQPSYLGMAHVPFEPHPDSLQNLQCHADISADRLRSRTTLVRELDRYRHGLDLVGNLAGQDAFREQAISIMSSSRVRDAFDVSLEPPSMHELYGGDVRSPFNYQFGHTWRGRFFLQARRLIEAGVPVVTLAPGAWDHHGNLNGVRGGIFQRMGERLPLLDRSLSALISDLYERGLDQDVLVVMWGEFGRTPRVNQHAGRDHWVRASFVLFSGGGLQTGQTIGQTDRTGATITSRPYGAQNVMAVIYRHLGIDPIQTFPNFAGRPSYILDDREPIAGLA